MNHIKNLIFDFDNTIAQTTEPIDIKVLEIIRKYNLAQSDNELLNIIRQATTNRQICENLISTDNVEECYLQILRINQKNVQTAFYHPEMIKTLKRLRHFYTMHILSGRDYKSLLSSLKQHHLNNLFSDVIGGDSQFLPKPAPGALNYIASKYNRLLSQIVLIGDSDADYQTAKNAGCNFIHACWYRKNTLYDDAIPCVHIEALPYLINSL